MARVKKKGITLSPVFLVVLIVLLPLAGFILGSKLQTEQGKITLDNSSTTYKSVEDKVRESKSQGFMLLSPKEGEILCRGEYYPITWETPSNVNTVDLYVSQVGAAPADTYDLGTFPSGYEGGKFSWRVGFTKGILWKPEEGTKELLSRPGYHIQISSPDKNFIDYSGTFTVTDCPSK